MKLLLFLHLGAATIWVGGMFFAHFVLRPALIELSEPLLRLRLMESVLSRFFLWVWGAVVTLLVTGYALLLQIFASIFSVPFYLLFMQAIGAIMCAIFLLLYFGPFVRFKTALASGDVSNSAKELAVIRKIVGTNLFLGILLYLIAVLRF